MTQPEPVQVEQNPIVGWGTTETGEHVPIHKDMAEAIWEAALQAERDREAAMPTEQDAINQLHSAYLRLEGLGWKNPIYAPKDGSPLELIEAGSSGIHRGAYLGKWPDGGWIPDDGEGWPMRPVLARTVTRSQTNDRS